MTIEEAEALAADEVVPAAELGALIDEAGVGVRTATELLELWGGTTSSTAVTV